DGRAQVLGWRPGHVFSDMKREAAAVLAELELDARRRRGGAVLDRQHEPLRIVGEAAMATRSPASPSASGFNGSASWGRRRFMWAARAVCISVASTGPPRGGGGD